MRMRARAGASINKNVKTHSPDVMWYFIDPCAYLCLAPSCRIALCIDMFGGFRQSYTILYSTESPSVVSGSTFDLRISVCLALWEVENGEHLTPSGRASSSLRVLRYRVQARISDPRQSQWDQYPYMELLHKSGAVGGEGLCLKCVLAFFPNSRSHEITWISWILELIIIENTNYILHLTRRNQVY